VDEGRTGTGAGLVEDGRATCGDVLNEVMFFSQIEGVLYCGVDLGNPFDNAEEVTGEVDGLGLGLEYLLLSEPTVALRLRSSARRRLISSSRCRN